MSARDHVEGDRPGSREPYYRVIARALRHQILVGDYRVDDRLPSEIELAATYGVSRMTARQAVSQLVDEGAVYRVQGRGAFVTHTTVSRNPNSLVGFYEDMERLGLNPGSQIVDVARRLPTDREQRELELGKGDPVVYIERIRFIDDEPVGLQRLTVPEGVIDSFDPETLQRGSFYALLAAQGTPIVAAHQRVEAVSAEDVSQRIGLERSMPFLKIHRVSRIESGARPVEMLTSWFRGDRYSYEGELRA